MNKKTLVVTATFFSIFILIGVSLWANYKYSQKQGITHLVEGPQGTLYLTVEDYLLKVSKEGELLDKMHLLYDLGIAERVTDICVMEDGRFHIGLHDLRQIRTYSPDGRLLHTYQVDPTDYDFRMAYDPERQYLFVAIRKSVDGIIQVFDPSWNRIMTIPDYPDSSNAASLDTDMKEEMEEDVSKAQDKRDSFDPVDIAYYEDRLHIADHYNRILIVDAYGSVADMITQPAEERGINSHPVRVTRQGAILYVINWDEDRDKGTMNMIDATTGARKHFADIDFYSKVNIYFNENMQYPDMVARTGDVLVTDQDNMKIRRFTHDGRAIGYFGEESLLDALSNAGSVYESLKLLRWGSMVAAVFLLFALVLTYKKIKKAPSEKSLLLRPVTADRLLGPEDSLRRKFLVITVPGLGQLAAGKKLRGIIFFFACFVTLLLFIYFALITLKCNYLFFYHALYAGVLLLLIRAAAVRDVRALNDSSMPAWDLTAHGIIKTLGLPFIPALIAAAVQITWDIYMITDPNVSLMIHGSLRALISYAKIADECLLLFSTLLPANIMVSWSLSVGAMFVCIAGKAGLPRGYSVFAGCCGVVAGIVSLVLFAALSSGYGGGVYYEPLVYGVSIGIVQLIVFRRSISALVVAAAVAGAGFASLLNFFIPIENLISLSMLLGASIRTFHVVFYIYFLTLATLLVLAATKRRNNSLTTET